MLGKKYSRRHFEIVFYFSSKNRHWYFMQIVSFCTECQSLFSRQKLQKHSSLSSAELAQKAITVKHRHFLRWDICMRQCFHMWRLCCPYFFFISPSFGASRGLCFVTVAFPWYLHLYFLCQEHYKFYLIWFSKIFSHVSERFSHQKTALKKTKTKNKNKKKKQKKKKKNIKARKSEFRFDWDSYHLSRYGQIQQTTNYWDFFHLFPETKIWYFMQIWRQFAWNVKSLFLGKNEEKIFRSFYQVC